MNSFIDALFAFQSFEEEISCDTLTSHGGSFFLYREAVSYVFPFIVRSVKSTCCTSMGSQIDRSLNNTAVMWEYFHRLMPDIQDKVYQKQLLCVTEGSTESGK